MRKYLFLGGPKDGQSMPVEQHLFTIRIPIMNPEEATTFVPFGKNLLNSRRAWQIRTYTLEYLRHPESKSASVPIFLCEGTDRGWAAAMIKAYMSDPGFRYCFNQDWRS